MATKLLCSIPNSDKGKDKTSSYPTCSIADCDRRAITRGWCKNHYERWRKHGSPTGGAPSPAPMGAPMAFVTRMLDSPPEQECVKWPYATNNRGYGTMMFRGRFHAAARVVCILASGEPPSALHEAAHSCGAGNLGCVNPAHLRWATTEENNKDKIDHGTSTRGETQARSKLTENDVRAIRRLGGTMYQREIAALYGVTTSHVGFILSRKTWAWLDD